MAVKSGLTVSAKVTKKSTGYRVRTCGSSQAADRRYATDKLCAARLRLKGYCGVTEEHGGRLRVTLQSTPYE